jgi:molybdopterin molybdotransferase
MDPHTGGPSRFPLVTCATARAHLRRFTPLATETIAVDAAAGRVLARDLRATMDLPHFARSYMDGYALRARDTAGATADSPARLRVVDDVEMGRPARRRVRRGEACRIPTGGMLPPGADAVVMVEHTVEPGGGRVEVQREARRGQHVMRRGSDVRRGQLLYRRGHRFRPHDVGALAGIGVSRVRVYRRPVVAIMATGDEIVPPDATPRPGQVRSINQYSLRAMIVAEGGRAVDLGVIPDRRAALARALARGLRAADMVVISGGSSVGVKDLTPAVIRTMPRARLLVHGIRVKPGKPTIIARAAGKPVLGLPGHPVSALVIFELFGAPLMRLLGGEPAGRAFVPHARVPARLAAPIASQVGREDYVRVALEKHADEWVARPLAGGSAEIFSFVHADGMIRVEPAAAGLAAGAPVEVQLHPR